MTESKRPRDNAMAKIEHKHFGRCIDQVWANGRRTLLELLEWPAINGTVVLVKRYEDPVPRNFTKSWPDLEACYVYVPLPDDDNTWDGLDRTLTEYASSDDMIGLFKQVGIEPNAEGYYHRSQFEGKKLI